MKRGSPGDLKWRRIERFATAAYAQGAALSLPDIAYLASVSVDAVRDVINDHPQIKLPTRGRVADMGSTLSHTEKIIDLFMYGYTETEIERRTGHSLDSIESVDANLFCPKLAILICPRVAGFFDRAAVFSV